MERDTWLHAWHPAVPGVREVLHARMTDHAYPSHTHADWALMLIDEGAVAYDLGGRARIADARSATLLPPGIAHDGRAAPDAAGFRKRVAYLDSTWLPEDLAGRAVDRPDRVDLIAPARRVHRALATPGEEPAAEAALIEISDRLLRTYGKSFDVGRDDALSTQLRDLLESRLVEGITLAEASQILRATPSRLSRAFVGAFGLPPHRYVTGRRIDRARGLLLDGVPPAAVAAIAGFHDQAHLTRHFRRVLGTTPARFARAGRSRGRAAL